MTADRPEYVIQYGRPAFVGRFRALAASYSRGNQVVVRTPRGLELGTVLCDPAERFARQLGPIPDGDVLRAAEADDVSQADRLAAVGQDLLATAGRLAAEAESPVVFLDAEVLLDGTDAILHVISFGETNLEPMLETLRQQVGLAVQLFDIGKAAVAKDAPPSTGCGKPDCGSGSGGCSSCGTGGGCSTGSCSKGSVKSADELTAYFADLRQQMDSHFGNGRTSLH